AGAIEPVVHERCDDTELGRGDRKPCRAGNARAVEDESGRDLDHGDRVREPEVALEPERKARYIDAADVAKMIRKNLKSRFPGVKFSVRTSKYSGGASVDVPWFDGPTQREVEEV